jgi:SAM-dependent methyltransferase
MAPSYSERLCAELATFAGQESIHDLSPIMGYYAGKVITPLLRALGYEDSYDFFATNIARYIRAHGHASVASYGCGNGELELAVGRALVSRGFDQFHFDCVDINADMLARARKLASAEGLAANYEFIQADACDPSVLAAPYDVHIAFQSLHHVQDLEALFDKIVSGMRPESIFLTNDMVGRNGHMRWPETLAVVEKLWSFLPEGYKYNHALGRTELDFVNFDCSRVGFEGIRAEEVFPLLARTFDFEQCVAWGGVVDPFIDRCFGPNFDPCLEGDRRFIDLASRVDAELQESGIVKPTQILALMRRKGCATPALDVSRLLRLGPPPEMPEVKDLSFDFSRFSTLVSHTFSGAPDEQYLDEGFWPWEPDNGHRWTRPTFSLRVHVRSAPVPYKCHFSIWLGHPSWNTAGLDVFVNRVLISHFVEVPATNGTDFERRLDFSFTTFGGETTVTFAFENHRRSEHDDDRELGAVVRKFSVTAEDP